MKDVLDAVARTGNTGRTVTPRRRWKQKGDDVDVPADGRRIEIVEATWHLIGTIGLEKTTMRRIADHVDCTTGLVTHYFASKDDILLAAIQQMMDKSRARMQDATKDVEGLVRLRSLVLAALPLDDERLLEWRVWLAFWGRAFPAPKLRKEQQLRFSDWRKAIRRAIDDAVTLGDVSPTVSVETETNSLVAMILGLSVETIVAGNRIDSDAMINVVDRHLAGLLPSDRASRGTSGASTAGAR